MLLIIDGRPTFSLVMTCRSTECTEINCYMTTSWKLNNSRSDQINIKPSLHTSSKHGVFKREECRKNHWFLTDESQLSLFIVRNNFGDWFCSLQEYGSQRGSASFQISGFKEVRIRKAISCQILHSCPMRNIMIWLLYPNYCIFCGQEELTYNNHKFPPRNGASMHYHQQ